MHRDELTRFLIDYLNSDEFNDDCPNGLQVEGNSIVKKIVTGVSASVRLFENAIMQKAEAIIVHHGLIWNYERPRYRGGYRERVRLLLENNINLYAFHLPLDAHAQVGNNTQLAKRLGLSALKPFGEYKGQIVGIRGEIKATDKYKVFSKIEEIVGRKPLIFEYGPQMIRSIGIISGGAQKDIKQAVAANLDLFLTGEVSEPIMSYAQEEGIHFVSAGHYATEKLGVMALGEIIEKKFNINVAFIDIPNPV
jgi:dinuclear metal center YbgI/SA1388 family protein